jgi:hypothetical protein
MGTRYSFGQSAFAQTFAISNYQEWDASPDSPETTADWPYQFIYFYVSEYRLHLAKSPFYFASGGYIRPDYPDGIFYILKSGNWDLTDKRQIPSNYWLYNKPAFKEANNDVFESNSYSTVFFAKTT